MDCNFISKSGLIFQVLPLGLVKSRKTEYDSSLFEKIICNFLPGVQRTSREREGVFRFISLYALDPKTLTSP